MLARAVRAIREGGTPDLDAPLEPVSQEVNLHVGARIPDDYLPDVHARLILYKRIASAGSQDELDDLRSEIVDRFGPAPDSLRQLLMVTGLKLAMQGLGIRKLDLGVQGGRLEFAADTRVDPLTVVRLVQTQTATYRLDGATQLRVSRNLPDFDARLAFARDLLEQLDSRPPMSRAASA
jgi:transcription-repair coupling factor (superfamily II helicase)